MDGKSGNAGKFPPSRQAIILTYSIKVSRVICRTLVTRVLLPTEFNSFSKDLKLKWPIV